MILLKFLGLVPKDAPRERIELDEAKLEEIKQELYDAAEAVMRARVAIGPMDWLDMFPAERAAMIETGNVLKAEQAVMTAQAVIDPEYRAALLEPQDGGEALRETKRSRALSDLSSKMDEIGKEFKKNVYTR